MTEPFDPYYKWLGIPADEQPPNHYRLLAVRLYEPDADVIEAATEQRMAHLRHYQAGPYAGLSQRILNELASARLCLLTPEKRLIYDQALRTRLSSRIPTAIPVRPPALPPRVAVATAVWKDPTAVPLDFVNEGDPHRMLMRRRGVRQRSPAAMLVVVSAIALAAVAVAFFVQTARTRQYVAVPPAEAEIDDSSESNANGHSTASVATKAESDQLPAFPEVIPHPVTLPDPPQDRPTDFRELIRQIRKNERRNRQPATANEN